jgi:hypothetical protein
MSDPTATLRALADACDECLRIASYVPDDASMVKGQRHALMRALPDVEGWPATATALRAMADEVDRLRAVIDNPGSMVSTWRPTRDQIVGIAHAQEVVITVPAGEIRDHLRGRLGVSS